MPTLYIDGDNGSDAAAGTIAAPLRTLTAAQTAARLLTALATDNIDIYLKGTFNLSSTLALTSADSGHADCIIRWQAWPDEEPLITSRTAVTGWVQQSEHIYYADIGVGLTFNHLFFGDRTISRRARYKGEALTVTTWDEVNDKLTVSNAAPFAVANPTTLEMVIWEGWNVSRMRVTSIAGSVVTPSNPERAAEFIKGTTNGPFHQAHQIMELRNALEFLSEAYEHFYDPTLGRLYVYAPAGVASVVQLEALGVYRPGTISTLVTLNDVNYVRFENCLEFGDVSKYFAGYVGYDSGLYFTESAGVVVFNRMSGVIELTNCGHVAFHRCLFRNIGLDAVVVRHGCKHISITENWLEDIASAAIKSDQTANFIDRITLAEQVENVYVRDNYIRRVGYDYAGKAVWLAASNKSAANHNDIQDCAAGAISLGTGSRFDPTSIYDLAANFNAINIALTKVHDAGALYTAGIIGSAVIDSKAKRVFSPNCGRYIGNHVSNVGDPDGVNWRGIYNGGTAYAVGDGVMYSAASFMILAVCIAPTTGNLPTNTAFWAIHEGWKAGLYLDLGTQGLFASANKYDTVDVPFNLNAERFNVIEGNQVVDQGTLTAVNYAGVLHVQYNAQTDSYSYTTHSTPYASSQVDKFNGTNGYPNFSALYPFLTIGALFSDGLVPPFNSLSDVQTVSRTVNSRCIGPSIHARLYWQTRGLLAA